MIPFWCDGDSLQEGIFDEQKNISDFMDYFLNNVDYNNKEYIDSNKFIFLNSVFKEIKWCLNVSKDKDYNNKMYYKREVVEYKKEYHLMRAKRDFYYCVIRKKKITTKLLIRNHLTFDKKK